jgi:hypothetical protein
MATVYGGKGESVTATIPNAGTNSDVVDLWGTASGSSYTAGARNITVIAPAAFTGTVTAESATDEAFTNAVAIRTPGGTDIAIAADKATIFPVPFGARWLRFTSSMAEAAARDLVVYVSRA